MKKGSVVNATGGVQTEDGRTLYGFDAEVYLKMKAKEDPNWKLKICEWIEAVTQETIPNKEDLWPALKDGLLLCRLINTIKPDLIKKYSTPKNGKLHPLMERENIGLYLEGCWRLGVQSSDMFVVADLHGRRNMQGVFNNIAALSSLAPMHGLKVPSVTGSAPPEQIDITVPEVNISTPQKPSKKWDVKTPYLTPVYTEELEDDDEPPPKGDNNQPSNNNSKELQRLNKQLMDQVDGLQRKLNEANVEIATYKVQELLSQQLRDYQQRNTELSNNLEKLLKEHMNHEESHNKTVLQKIENIKVPPSQANVSSPVSPAKVSPGIEAVFFYFKNLNFLLVLF